MKRKSYRGRHVLLYVLRDGVRVKVGATSQFTARYKTICYEQQSRPKLLYLSHASFLVEKMVHGNLRHHRIKGEWYRWSEALVADLPRLVAETRARYHVRRRPIMSDEGDAEMPNNPETAAKGPTGLAKKMEAARKERGVTQGQLAERLHIKQAMVSMIEGGEADYGDELAGRIRSWIDSGAGAPKKSARGPYKIRTTIQGR